MSVDTLDEVVACWNVRHDRVCTEDEIEKLKAREKQKEKTIEKQKREDEERYYDKNNNVHDFASITKQVAGDIPVAIDFSITDELKQTDFYEIRNGFYYDDPLKYHSAFVFVEAGVPVSQARDVVKRDDWAYSSESLAEIFGNRPELPMSYGRLNVLYRSLERAIKQRQSALTQEMRNLYDNLQVIQTTLSAVTDNIVNSVKMELINLHKYFEKTKVRDIDLAQRRLSKLMEGKRFSLSEKDQVLLNRMAEYKEVKHIEQVLHSLHKVTKKLGTVGMVANVVDIVVAFKKANDTGNWDEFTAKILGMTSAMLTFSLICMLPTTGLLAGLAVSIVAVVTSSLVGDENNWKKLAKDINNYHLEENNKR